MINLVASLGAAAAAACVAGCGHRHAHAAPAYVGPAYVAAAPSGGWRLDPTRCPDLVEDVRDRRESRRDRRVNRGPLDRIEDRVDRRESRRDERVTVCPNSAWVWTGGRAARSARPAAAPIYFDPLERRYYRLAPRGGRVFIVVS